MGRKKSMGRGDGGRRGGLGRGRGSLTVIDEEIFEGPIGEDEIEAVSFVVSSPMMIPSIAGAISASQNPEIPRETVADLSNTGSTASSVEGGLLVAAAAKGKSVVIDAPPASIPTGFSTPARKWGERVEEEEIEKSRIPEISVPVAGVQDKKKSWASVVGNRNSANGLKLDFVPPKDGIVEFTNEDINAGISAWETAVVGQIMEGNPKFKEIVGFVHRAWSRIGIPRIHQLQPGVFMFNFATIEAKESVMARNWHFNGAPIMLSNWSPDYKPATEKPTKMPVWIKLPGLNLQFWSKQGIEKLASAVGIPLSTDSLTANKEAIRFARVLVEIDLLKPYPASIDCRLPDGTPFKQEVQYESIPDPPRWDIGNLEKQKPQDSASLPEATSSENGVKPGDTSEQMAANTNAKKKKKKKKKGSESQSPGDTQMNGPLDPLDPGGQKGNPSSSK